MSLLLRGDDGRYDTAEFSPMHLRPIILVRLALIALAAAPLTLAVPHLFSDEERSHSEGSSAAPSIRPGAVRHRDGAPILGCAIVAHHIGDLSLYLRSVDRIAELGANALVVVTPMFQERADSTEIRFVPEKCPTDEQLLAILRRAKERGLTTALQPIVLIEHPGEKEWRGTIAPADWAAWWRSYDAFLDRFLDIATAAKVDLFTVGSELNSTEEQIDRWEAIVSKARARYTGALTYSANWDRYKKVQFWPLVDVLSVSAYFELQRDDPSAAEDLLIRDWMVERDHLLSVARAWERPLLLSEVGYPSLPWASAHPWNYVASSGTQADHEAQARCYRAFFTSWSDAFARRDGGALGFFCYHWDPYHHGQDEDTGYGIFGKPSERVVRDGFRRILKQDGADSDS